MSKVKPRKTPCPSCPYRRDVPSGIWSAEEYDKLPGYDGSTAEQAMAGAFAPFFCHQRTGELCAGWVGCHDMDENLAIRVSREDLDVDAIFEYQSPVPLFSSGAEAAEHGKREIRCPGASARKKIDSLIQMRERQDRDGS